MDYQQQNDAISAPLISPPIKPFLRIQAVKCATGLGKSAIYQKVKEGSFPAPVKLSSRAVGWRYEDIQKWIDERIQSREKL